MHQFFIGALFGMFVSIFLEPLILWLTFRKKDKPSIQAVKVTPTNLQIELIKGAIPTCTNLNWFNVLLQRFFLEVTPSYAYKERIKKNFYKKTAKIKTFCELEITDVDFGSEYPVFKKAKLVTQDDINKIIQSIKNKRIKTKENKKRPDSWRLTDSEKELLGKTDTDSIFDDLNSNLSDFADNELCYDNVMVLFEMEYNGVYRIDCILKFPQGLELAVKFELHHLTGPLLVRFPAIYNHTRIEISMLNIDRLDFKIESEIQNKYLERTATSIINKYFTTLVKSNYLYPRFYSKYIPTMVPSMKEISYVFDNALDETTAIKYTDDICMYMAMDYKVSKIKNGLIMRKGSYCVNKTKDKLKMVEFCIKDFFECENKEIPVSFSVEESRWEINDNDDKNESDGNGVYNLTSEGQNLISTSAGLHSEDNKNIVSSTTRCLRKRKIHDSQMLNSFYDLYIRDLQLYLEILEGFVGIKNIKEYKNHTKINIIFKDKQFLFNRIDADNAVIFQSDTSAEYFAFKVRALQVLEIYYYTKDPHFAITQDLMLALKRKTDATNLKFLKKMDFVKRGDDQEIIQIDRTKVNKIIYELKECIANKTFNDNNLGNLQYKDFRISDNIKNVLEHLRINYRLRFRLLFESFHVKNEPKVTDIITTYQVHVMNSQSIVYSYNDENFIIDIIDESKMIGYAQGDGDDTIRLFYNNEILSSLFHAFMFGIKVFIRIDKCLSETIILEKTFLKGIKYVEKFSLEENTALCVEINVNVDDEIYFSVYDTTNKIFTLEKMKIVGKLNRACIFILPIKTNSTQTISLKSKHDPFSNQLRISKILSCKDTLIDTVIEIAQKKKYKYYFQGIEQYSLYWDIEQSEINAYCLTDTGIINTNNTGLMLTKNESYGICLVNKTRKKICIDIKLGSIFIEG